MLLQQVVDDGGSESEYAVKIARRRIEIAPEFPLGHYHLGKAHFQSDPDAAARSLQAWLERRPDATTAIDALFHAGALRHQAGDLPGARAFWQQAVDQYPGNIHTRFCEINLGLSN